MSSNLPPTGPPPGPLTGPPPAGSSPELLERGRGGPIPPGREAGSGAGKKGLFVGGGIVAVLALAGGGVWAAMSFLGTGAQPAEALPDSTLGYASIDLDPSGGQKIEALKTLRKFPAFKDKVGLNTDDDLRERLFQEIQKSGSCTDIDYADDIAPWLGDRAAVAAVDLGADQPAPVMVVQVKNAGAAEVGLKKLKGCAAESSSSGSASDTGGYVVDGDWAVFAESADIAQQVVDAATKAPLSEDADYSTWTSAAGDPGIVSLYASPKAGAYLAENADSLFSFGSDFASSSSGSSFPGATQGNEELSQGLDPTLPPEITDALKNFEGAAVTVRFSDGALEVESAGGSKTLDALGLGSLAGSDQGGDVISTLPDDTAAAVGVGFADGWFTDLVDYVSTSSGGSLSAGDLIDEMSQATGLDLPGDAETLAGESAAIAVGGNVDPETFVNSSDGSDVPVAVKVKGDPKAIESVLDKVRAQLGDQGSTVLGSDSDGDTISIGPNADYRAEVAKDGALGESPVYQDVVPESDRASTVFFLNVDEFDSVIEKLSSGDPEFVDNVKPLSGIGVSAWRDGDVTHSVLRITTD